MHTTRMAAAKAGDSFYMTGKPCKHGHTARRLTLSGGCYECLRESNRKYYEKVKGLLADNKA